MERSLNQWLFSTPWWLPAIIAAVGAALWISGNKRIDKTLKVVGLGIALIGVALALVSYFVETKVERVTRRTRELVSAVAGRDWPKTASLLDEKASFKAQSYFSFQELNGRQEIVGRAQEQVDRAGLTGARVTALDVQDNGPLLTASMTVFSTHDRGPGLTRSDWQLAWEKTADDWVVTDITFIRLGLPDASGK